MVRTGGMRVSGGLSLPWLWRCWLVLLVALTCGASHAQTAAATKGVRFAPVPAWVVPQTAPLDTATPAEGLDQGRHYLLVDTQVRATGPALASYHHVASRAVNERGVEEVASVSLQFDPSYQTLVIHRIEVKRGGKTVSTAQPGAVKLLQREASLESLIFDGRLTAHVALHDVRVGDVVEYVYSVQGSNPVFGGRHFGSFDLDWDTPVAARHVRLLWPQGHPPQLKRYNQAAAPRVTELAGETEYRWDLRDVPARRLDSDTPGWYDPYTWVEWSDFEDWAAVARWAVPLYHLPDAPPPAIAREIERIAAQTADPEQRLLAALRFVQREVRYLGIEMGANSHEPHRPELVLQRRFGDCKDKTLLTLALLRGLGITARPALVHTSLRQSTAERLPTPGAFNHVLVQADLGERKVWLDPTRAPQGGKGLAQWVQSDFGRALLVDAGTRELVPMAGADARRINRQITAVLDASAGFDQPATFTVTTRANGESAEQLRAALANNARDALQKQYLDYYAASYTGLTVDQPFTVRDDLDANTVEIVERYRMPSYWTRDDKKKRWNGEMEVPDLMAWLQRPQGLNRHDPLSLRHPVDFTLVSEFRLPGKWDLKPDKLAVDDPAFSLHRDEAWHGNVLTLTDHYVSRADHVDAQDTARYVAQLDKARTGVNYSLYYADSGPAAQPATAAAGSDSPHWVPMTVGLLGVGGLFVLLRRLHRWDPTPWPHGAPVESAIGGWLWLPVIGLVLSPLRVGKVLVESAPALTVQTWTAVTQPGSPAYHPLWGPTLLVETLLNLAICAGALGLLWLMAKRRSSLPRLYIAWWLLVCATMLGDAAMHQLIPGLAEEWTPKETGELWRTCLFGGLWITYFLRSDRVRRTFVRRLHGEALPPPGPAPATPVVAESDPAPIA